MSSRMCCSLLGFSLRTSRARPTRIWQEIWYCRHQRHLSTSKSVLERFEIDSTRPNIFTCIPRRSILFVPADDAKKVNKATTLPADCIVLECEDGVAINRKEDARANVNQILGNVNFGQSECAVRINSVDSGFADEDLKAALTGKILPDAILLPKVQGKEDIVWLADQMNRHIKDRGNSKPSKVALITFTETAIGLLNLRSILETASYPDLPFRHEAVTFGADDFLANIGATKTDDAKELIFARQSVVTHCKAFGLQAIDMVHINFKDHETLRNQSEEGYRMGFTGKQLIHPSQISVINEAFTPSKLKIDWAEELIQAFEEHQKTGKGAFVFRGSMIDMPLLKQAKNITKLTEIIRKREIENS